ncbi:TrkH family potassium uptake protein [Selenomonas sp. TAMA-11512]|uniref:TrkH family potassium uptake protein n=1 Tax=Selenomonas sp. TAMA-11512 TaxID=3095337 RepID=UPI0030913BFF|nr:TrkH family potassium uptake protein [Selenomonas sp. TAMA-11512]
MDYRVVSFFLGRMAYAMAIVFYLPLSMAAAMRESVFFSFLASLVIAVLFGTGFRRFGKRDMERLSIREGIAITGLGWILASLLGMLPFFLGGYLPPFDAFFESLSGLTGTGATVFSDVESLPRSILFWRSLTHWLGGLGIIVIFIALLPQTGQSTMQMYNAEANAPTEMRVLPKLKDTTSALFRLYLALTLFATAVLFLAGLSPFDAVNHAMSAIGSGGFSTYNDSAAHFHSAPVELWLSFFMFLSGGSFALYYQAYRKGLRVFARNNEFRVYALLIAAAILIITVDLVRATGEEPLLALRHAIFQATSLSTTGFVSTDFDVWPGLSQGVLLLLMIIGGSSGSTAAGLKISRVVLLFLMLRAVVWEKMHPRIALTVEVNGRAVAGNILHRTAVFFFIYIFSICVIALFLTFDGISSFDALGISITTLGCIGPAFGVAGATETYADLSTYVKAVLCFSMLLGRLEIFTVLAMLSPSFWRGRTNW